MSRQSLTGRLEKLEQRLGDDRQPDHFIHYTYGYGDDEVAAKDAAEAAYRATQHVKPDDMVGFIAIRIVSPNDPHDWIWAQARPFTRACRERSTERRGDES
jgi:hypothetical protein